MPTVGDKKFPYTPEGKADAKAFGKGNPFAKGKKKGKGAARLSAFMKKGKK
jgi:hypothetical protein